MAAPKEAPDFQDVPLATFDGNNGHSRAPVTSVAMEAADESPQGAEDAGCCAWLCGHGARRQARPRTKAYSEAYHRAVQRAQSAAQKAKAWEAAQEERIVSSKWYSKVFDCLTCYDPQIEAAQQARHPDARRWALGLCDCVRYRDVQGRGNWILLWSLLWPNWTFGMLWTEYVEEPQVCDNVCWDVCVTMGWRGILCCCLLFPLQWGTACSVFLPCFAATSYAFRKATVNKYGIKENAGKTLLYGAGCPFCSMSQIYVHITEVHDREDLARLQREAYAQTPQTLTDAPATLEMERPAGLRPADVEMTEAGGLAAAESAGAEAPRKAKLGERVRKQAGKELNRVFHKREQGLGDGAEAPDEFLDAANTLRYQHVPWSKVGC